MIVIETLVSFLKTEDFNDIKLLEECVEYIRDKLIEYPQIKIYDRVCRQRRCVGFFSNESIGYKYSGQIAKSKPLISCLAKLLTIINEKYNSEYNGILVNLYKSGEDYISAHSDDETNLDNSGVVALSYGATRKFRIREKTTRKIISDIPLTSGSIIQMGGDFQKEFLHEIPVERRVKKERISFTFRKHNK